MIIKGIAKIKKGETIDVLGDKVNKELENIRNTLNSLGTKSDDAGNIIITTDRGKVKRNDAYYIDNVVKKRISNDLKDAIESLLPKVDTTPPDHTQLKDLSEII